MAFEKPQKEKRENQFPTYEENKGLPTFPVKEERK